MERTTLTLGEIIENNVNIFDFEYPFYSEEYRPTFERHFIEHFYFDEIGQETVAKFKQRLKIKFNLIMPYWNKIFLADNLEQRILDNYDVTETYTREIANNSTATNESTNKNLQSDTPVTKTDLEQVDYFSNIVKDIGNNTSNVNNNSSENWERRMQGNIGVQTDSDAIIKYWNSLRQIENEIFEQCSNLFMEVW
nr:MAG TPA: Lower collar protein [Caudoviricetes sp.]